MLHRFQTARVVALAAACAFAAILVGGGALTASADHGNQNGNNGHNKLVVSASHGDDGNACTANAPCKTIGRALSVASDGAQITVRVGTYAEQVMVTTDVTLLGKHGAKIDATGQVNGIVVSGASAAGTTISGLDVENAIGEGILIESTSNVTVRGNHLANNDKGFNTNVTQECAAQGEVPGDCGEALHLMSVVGAHVTANTIENNIGGILITDELGPSHDNLIVLNVSRNNAEDCGITLPSHNPMALGNPSIGGVYRNVVAFNVSENNGGAGVGMFAPFPGAASYDNIVFGNRLTGNGEAGIAIHAHAPQQDVSGNVMINNDVSGNGIDPDSGSGHPTGIALFTAVDPQTVTVSNNRISNEFWGIFIAGPMTVNGLATNIDASSVTHATN